MDICVFVAPPPPPPHLSRDFLLIPLQFSVYSHQQFICICKTLENRLRCLQDQARDAGPSQPGPSHLFVSHTEERGHADSHSHIYTECGAHSLKHLSNALLHSLIHARQQKALSHSSTLRVLVTGVEEKYAFFQIRSDRFAVHLRLLGIRDHDHDNVSSFGRVGNRHNRFAP